VCVCLSGYTFPHFSTHPLQTWREHSLLFSMVTFSHLACIILHSLTMHICKIWCVLVTDYFCTLADLSASCFFTSKKLTFPVLGISNFVWGLLGSVWFKSRRLYIITISCHYIWNTISATLFGNIIRLFKRSDLSWRCFTLNLFKRGDRYIYLFYFNKYNNVLGKHEQT
jgi:hypothetical protein